MDKDKYIQRLKGIYMDLSWDIEAVHSEADKVLCGKIE